MSLINIGVVGVGHMGSYHANILSSLQDANFSGVYDLNDETSKKAADKYSVKSFDSLKKLLRNVDAVCIAVPTNLHYEISKLALEHNVHVLVEKPITRTVEEAEELINLANDKNLILQVGHIERFNGAIRQIKNIIDKPYFIEARRLAPFTDRIKDVGVVLDMMIHDIDIVLNLLGDDIKCIDAVGSSVYSNFEDVAAAHLKFNSGCIVDINASRITTYKERSLAISQGDSYIFLDYDTQDINIHKQLNTGYKLDDKEIQYRIESSVERVFIHNVNPLQQEIMHFIDCIVNNAKPLVESSNDIKTLSVANEIVKKILINSNKKPDN